MRGFLSCMVASAMFSLAVRAADTGVPPRASANDYPVQRPADAATIAAVILPPDQVSKMFSPEIGKKYIVVEVAIYPESGLPFDVQSSDFALRVGQRVGRADRPIDVAPWPERRDPTRRLPVDVTTRLASSIRAITTPSTDDIRPPERTPASLFLRPGTTFRHRRIHASIPASFPIACVGWLFPRAILRPPSPDTCIFRNMPSGRSRTRSS